MRCRPSRSRRAGRPVATSRFVRSGLAAVAVAAASFTAVAGDALAQSAAPAGSAAAPAQWPAEVSAVYRITFGGMDVGRFHYSSKVNGASYTMDARADIKAVLGAFEWQGRTSSSGSASSGAPKPQAYNFDFKSSAIIGRDKSGFVRMGFKEGAVSALSVQPTKPPPPDMVPLKDEHKQNVLDPLSAVMALSLGSAQRPCDRKLAIFDGKQRFDLAFAFRGQQKIAERRPSGQPGIGFVCKVRYTPIAGYRQNEETREFIKNTEIEMVFRPVPSANLSIPYQVTIPTAAGTAMLIAEKIAITTPGRAVIALSN